MLNLLELEQLAAFADQGTLSKAAEVLHISQPTITRTMQHLEEEFGVPLFSRSKNKIQLNDTGKKAVEYARSLLADAREAVVQVRAFDKRLHTITVQSCAPAPLWSLLPILSSDFPGRTISSTLSEKGEIIRKVAEGDCELGILPWPVELEGMGCVPLLEEKLSVCVPKEHHLAHCKSLTFEELNGFNCLLLSQIGFWDKLCREKMPASRFLVQTDPFEFTELVRHSSLLCFTTDLARDSQELYRKRNKIPVTDPEANVTYYLLFTDSVYRTVAEKCRSQS